MKTHTNNSTQNDPKTTPKAMRLMRALGAGSSCYLRRSPRWIKVESSALNAVSYDRSRRALHAEFASESRYEYGCVEPSKFIALMAADSTGRYFVEAIRNGGYPYRKLSA
jgi:hypothetical protein